MKFPSARLSFALLVVLPAAGCGGGDQPLPVRGTVYFKDVPLSGGTIVFIPDEERGGRGPMARAEIGPDGNFELRTDDAAGAVAGWHRVTVAGPAPPPHDGPQGAWLPTKYRDPELSGLSCLVRPGEDNRFEFRLE